MAKEIEISLVPSGWLGRLLNIAIDGWAAFPSASETAANQLGRDLNHETAITALTRNHVAAAGAQGFATNLGGILTLPVAAPANLVGVAVINARLAAAIAHLRGYDLTDPRVRTATAMCLLGPRELAARMDSGELPSIWTVATAPVPDDSLVRGVQARIGTLILNRIGGKQIVGTLLKRIPVAGGVVGAGTDGWLTWEVGRLAQESFVSRRRG